MKSHWAMLLLGAALLAGAVGCVGARGHMPPAPMMMHPGPGVDGPGPGVMIPPGALPGSAGIGTSQVMFRGPDGMEVTWDEAQAGAFDSAPLITPGRYNFPRGAIYRLKLATIPGRPGEEFFPTLEVAPGLPRSEAFLAHNAIPVSFTDEDFEQVATGNFVTKVIYLPDAEFQELALAGVEELVSTRLDPGVDPIEEADRRGAILAIVRVGNKDLAIPGSMNDAALLQASYSASLGASGCGCDAGAYGYGGEVYASSQAAVTGGVGMPQYGMPYVGTPIGLPGPAHVPLGGPAGLRKHTMRNHTFSWIPGPVRKLTVDLVQWPGHKYPSPASHALVMERSPRQPLFGAGCDTCQ